MWRKSEGLKSDDETGRMEEWRRDEEGKGRVEMGKRSGRSWKKERRLKRKTRRRKWVDLNISDELFHEYAMQEHQRGDQRHAKHCSYPEDRKPAGK